MQPGRSDDVDFHDRWMVRGGPGDAVLLLRRAAEYLDSVGPDAVSRLTLDRVDGGLVLTVSFQHWQLPADLDYLDPRIAGDGDGGHYSAAQREDVDFMLALAAELDARSIVDFGCGTGQLAVALAQQNYRVIGVDPAKAILDVARTRAGAGLVQWICGDVDALTVHDVSLIVMTGNIPSIFVTDEAWLHVLGVLHGALRPGGHLAFGSWNPEDQPWDRWGFDVVALPAGHGVRVRVPGYPIESPDGRETLVAGSEWRYRTYEELTQSLQDAGFEVDRTYGDWHRSPLTPVSPDIIVVARRNQSGP